MREPSASSSPLMRRHDREFEAQRPHDAEDCAKFWIAFCAKSFVEAFARQPSFLGSLRHAARPRHGPQRIGDKGRITRFQRFFHVGMYGFAAVQIFGGVVRISFRFLSCRFLLSCDQLILQVRRKPLRRFDVFHLRAFIAATQQDHQGNASSRKLNTITRTIVSPEFANALSDRLNVTGISHR